MSTAPTETTRVRHGKVELAVHCLRATGDAHPLLLLHGLGERTPAEVPPIVGAWPGPIWGLDFTGHGDSTVPRGGGYTAEMLMADVDAALRSVGPATVLGRGLGAYVALLIAGARPTQVRGAVLADGPGLAGGGSSPGSPSVILPTAGITPVPDPYALHELTRDVRPADYAVTFVRQAVQASGLDNPIGLAAIVRPPWLAGVADEPGVVVGSTPELLALFAR